MSNEAAKINKKAMKPLDSARLAQLLRGQRWGCLGTQRKGKALVSWVAFTVEEDFSGLLLHLSRLAQHTRNLETDPEVSLALSEADDGHADPQTLARLSLQGRVEIIDPQAEDYAAAKARYLAALPEAEMLFQFGDFSLFRFVPESARYVDGFASSHSLTPAQLQGAAQQK